MQDEKEEKKEIWQFDIFPTSFKVAHYMKIWEGLPEISSLYIYYKM